MPRCQGRMGRRKDLELGLPESIQSGHSFLSMTLPPALYPFTQTTAPRKEVKGTDRWCPRGDPAQKMGSSRAKLP